MIIIQPVLALTVYKTPEVEIESILVKPYIKVL